MLHVGSVHLANSHAWPPLCMSPSSHSRLFLQVVFLELCSERRGILTMTKQEVRRHHQGQYVHERALHPLHWYWLIGQQT